MYSVKKQSTVKDRLVVETESYYTPQAGLEPAVLLLSLLLGAAITACSTCRDKTLFNM